MKKLFVKNIRRKPFEIFFRKNKNITDIKNSHFTYIEGHRGIDYEPENTLNAFKSAIETQCDSIELDVINIILNLGLAI